MKETNEKNFLNSKNKQEQSTASEDHFSAGGSQDQVDQLKEMGSLIISIEIAINKMVEKSYQCERIIDSLEQCSCSNCLISHSCQGAPKKASTFEFECFLCKKN